MYGTLAPSDILNRIDQHALFTPGGLYKTEDGRTFRYVKFVAESVDAAAGYVAMWSDTNTIGGSALASAGDLGAFDAADFKFPYKVTADRDQSNAVGCGVWTCAIDGTYYDGYYTFIQTGGPCRVMTDTGNNVAALDQLGIHATDDGGTVDHDVTTNPIGWAMLADDDATDKVLIWLTCAE